MSGPYTSIYLRREELEEKLGKLFDTLQQKGILPPDADKEALIQETAKNIGDFPKENLNDPTIQLKMAVALVATFNKKDNPESINLDWLFKKDVSPEEQIKEIEKIINEFREKNPEGAKKLDEMVDSIILKLSAAAPTPGSKTSFIADDAGVPQVYLYGEDQPLGSRAAMIFSLLIATHAELPKVLEDEAFPERFQAPGYRPAPP